MQGIIIKHLKELYFVYSQGKIIESKARGVFREKKIKPIVGDKVDILLGEDGRGYIEKVYERKNELIRPKLSNIDFVLNIHSINEPDLNTYMLDKALVMAEFYGIKSAIIFSKSDLTSKDSYEKYFNIYNKASYEVFQTSIYGGRNEIEKIRQLIKEKISAVSGPSGSGKSTIINALNEDLNVETSKISDKTKRGKHTTRHIELMPINENTFILDTPGFSTIDLSFIEDERNLDLYFPEMASLRNKCKFNNCSHINEPKCYVKDSLGDKISRSRYENYLLFFEEVKDLRRY